MVTDVGLEHPGNGKRERNVVRKWYIGTVYSVFVKSACTFHKKYNSGKLEIDGKFEFTRKTLSFSLIFPNGL